MKKRVFSLVFVIALLCIVLTVGATSVLAASETDISYPAKAGYIYFDKETGTITDCDEVVTAATIPAEIDGVAVTAIGDYAFEYCGKLQTVEIPDSVTTIGYRAFEYCEKLQTVEIPDSVTTIGERAFCFCEGMVSVTIGNSVTTIGYDAFYGCDSLQDVTIPDSVTVIKASAFGSCDSLKSVTIGNSVTIIGDGAFKYCDELVSVTIGNSVTTIGKSAFYYCRSLQDVTIPNGVTTIGASAFYDCASLTSASIPDSVTSIGDSAFYNCEDLTSISIPDGVTAIGASTFYNCKALTSISIPDGVTTIGASTFYNCAKLKIVVIPESVNSLGEKVFSGCSSLLSVTIPEGVTEISTDTFKGCHSLTSVTIPGSVKSICTGAFCCSAIDNVYYNGTKEAWALITVQDDNTALLTSSVQCTDGVVPQSFCDYNGMIFDKSIGKIINYVGPSLVGEVIIPAEIDGVAVKSIGKKAFYLKASYVERIVLPYGLETVEDYAFYGCDYLSELVVPVSVKRIGYSAIDHYIPPFADSDYMYDLFWRFCNQLTVYYGGTQADWGKIALGESYLVLYAEAGERVYCTEEDLNDGLLDGGLSFSMDITAGSEMRVTYSIPASNVDTYKEFYLVVNKEVAGDTLNTTFYGLTADREAMTAVLHPTTNEVLTYQATYTGINAKEMGDSFEATLYAVKADGRAYRGATIVSSIKDFLTEKLNDEASSAEMKTLAVDMLKYGAAAQVRFDYDTDNLVTATLTEEQLALGTQTVPAAVDRCSTSGEGVNISTNICVNSKVELTISCIADGQADPASVKCVITDEDGKVLAELATTNKLGVMYSAMYDNVGAKQMREVISATFYNAEGTAISKTVNWSIESYVAQVRANAELTEAEIAAADAMLVYGDSVAAYMRANGQ